MKKLLVVAVLVALLGTHHLQAQNRKAVDRFFRLGVKGGASLGKINGQGYDQSYNLGYYLGGFVQLNFTKMVGVQGEANFSSGTVKTSSSFNDIYTTAAPGNSNQNIKLNYLQIPVLLNVSLGTSRIKLQLGPQYSIYTGHKTFVESTGQAFKSGDVAAVGGLWFQLPIINIHARYLLGISNISDIPNSDRWRYQQLQLGVGLTF